MNQPKIMYYHDDRHPHIYLPLRAAHGPRGIHRLSR